jgi:lipopolysaccharide transport system permease protein
VNSRCSLSPLVYPNSLVQARWRGLDSLNPMAGVIEGFRWAFTGQRRPPDLMLLAYVGVVLIVVSELIYFNKMESTVASVV